MMSFTSVISALRRVASASVKQFAGPIIKTSLFFCCLTPNFALATQHITTQHSINTCLRLYHLTNSSSAALYTAPTL